MSKTFHDRLQEDRRLVLLRLLSDLPGYRSNSSVLCMLMNDFGHVVARDYIKSQLAWLAEQHLVTVNDLQGLTLATLTERGHDVSRGMSEAPGVARPGA